MKRVYWVLIIVGVALVHGLAMRYLQPTSGSIVMSHFDTAEPFTFQEKMVIGLNFLLSFPLLIMFLMGPLGSILPVEMGYIIYILNSLVWGLMAAAVVSLLVPKEEVEDKSE